MSGSGYTYEDKEDFQGKTVRVLGPTYEQGKPDSPGDWRGKLTYSRGDNRLSQDGTRVLVQRRMVWEREEEVT